MPAASALVLTSLKNPRVAAVLALGEAKHRQASGFFALEGAREIGRAVTAGYQLTELFICPEALSPAARDVLSQVALTAQVRHYQVSLAVFAKLAVRQASDGLVAVMAQRTLALADVKLPRLPLILALQGVEKPGNLGALLRSADGAGADLVVVLDRALDLYHPHVLRTSLGTVFSLAVVGASSRSFQSYCREHALAVHAAALTPTAVSYTAVDYTAGCVLLLGEEAAGLTPDWLAAAASCIKVPMLGAADSLNVSVAGAVLLYEARRQRSVQGCHLP